MNVTLLTTEELYELLTKAAKAGAEQFAATQTPQLSTQSEEPFLSVKAVTKELSISRVTLRSWEKAGLISPHRIGRRIYFKRSDLINKREGNK